MSQERSIAEVSPTATDADTSSSTNHNGASISSIILDGADTLITTSAKVDGMAEPTGDNNNSKDLEANNDPEPNLVAQDEQTKLNDTASYIVRIKDVIRHFPYMGCTAFGGPAMAVTLLQKRFVNELKWVDEPIFKELFALCQGFPGPTQGLMTVTIGTSRAGLPGGVIALILYSLPGFIVMTVFGMLSFVFFDPNQQGTPDWMTGLGPAAISLLFLACWKLGKTHCFPSNVRMFLGIISAIGTSLVIGDARVDQKWSALMFPAFLLGGGLTTYLDSKRKGRQALYYTGKPPSATDSDLIRKINISKPCGAIIIILWLTILVTVVVLRGEGLLSPLGELFESLFRVGSMIFGGGYVVLPMLLQENIVSPNQFFQGFALVQALPGPLFNFSAFLGAASQGIAGAFVAAVALFAPGTMLLLGFMPYWTSLRRIPGYRAFVTGVSATAIGFVVAACIELWELAIQNAADAVVFIATGTAVGWFNANMPLSIFLGALLGFSLSPTALGIGQEPFCAPQTGNETTFE